MKGDNLMRRALWATSVMNLLGALLFAFPSSPLGQLAGLPLGVPLLYRALMAVFVVLFGGAYAWLATEPSISPPLVGLAAVGKIAVFAAVLLLFGPSGAPRPFVFRLRRGVPFSSLFRCGVPFWGAA